MLLYITYTIRNKINNLCKVPMANLQIVPAYKNVEAQYVEMMVPLYSYGCEKKVKKTLAGIKGIYSVNVDYNQQKVTVWGICNKHDVLNTMRTKRKEARFWNDEDNIEMEEESQKDPNKPMKPMTLTTVRSLSWKAWKMVFKRSYSF